MANATPGWRLSWSRLDAARCRRRLKTRGAVAAETQTYMYSNMLLYSTVDGNLGTRCRREPAQPTSSVTASNGRNVLEYEAIAPVSSDA